MNQVIERLMIREQHKPWAVLPRYFDGLIRSAATGKAESLFWSDEKENDEPASGYVLGSDGVAVVRIRGILLKEPEPWEKRYLGAASTVEIGLAIAAAMEDPKVKGILLDIDSPGGTADGTFTLADAIYAMRGTKPIIAFANGLAASGGYLVAAAANQIIMPQTAEVGSIGVRITLEDWSQWNEKVGIRVNIISSGKYKAAGDPDTPLDNDARAYFQGIVDQYHALFVEKIAAYRGSTPEALAPVADGRTFLAAEAVEFGLADQIGELPYAQSLVLTYKTERGNEAREERKPVMGMIDAVKRILAGKPLDEGDPEEAQEVVETVKAALTETQTPAAETSSEAAQESEQEAATVVDPAAQVAAAAKAERERAAAILASGRKLGLGAQDVEKVLMSDATLPKALEALIAMKAEGSSPLEPVTNRVASPDAAAQAEQAVAGRLLESAKRIAEARSK